MTDKKIHAETNQELAQVKILHLSDLHVGMQSDAWLWPGFKGPFFDDLQRLFRKSGAWDIVVFSGDLSQKAMKEEFDRVTIILSELWGLFQSLGFSPTLFPVPGNHDLTRPAKLDPSARLLSQWWSDLELQKAFWDKEGRPYLESVKKAFKNYENWVNSLPSNIPVAPLNYGLIPGDVSAILSIHGKNVGLVGLNSTWLQLSDGDYEGKLHVDVRQILEVTNRDPDSWCRNNNINLLVTHHPSSWLHQSSLATWKSDINTRGRFDCHMFGHMHVPNSGMISEAGGQAKQTIQAASLFGLEFYNDVLERIHGYSLVSIQSASEERRLTQWPRIARILRDGTRKVVADQDFDLSEDDSYSYKYGINQGDSKKIIEDTIPNNPVLDVAPASDSLQLLRFSLPRPHAYLYTRKVEQAIAISSLEEKRILWLVSDWGLATDEFIASIQSQITSSPKDVYIFDMQSYRNRIDILKGIKDQTGYSFEQICEQISLAPPSILILNDVLIKDGNSQLDTQLQEDIENLGKIVTQYCPRTNIVIKSRNSPQNSDINTVELRPFDEVDTANYVKFHELGQEIYANNVVSQIFRHTDGVPSRIDSILRDIPVVGASEIRSLNIDISGKSASSEQHPPGLVALISEMEISKDPGVNRALALLKVLTVFPRGEQFSSVKRFNSGSGFYIENVHTLIDAALVDSIEILSVGNDVGEDAARALVVRRPVREYLYTHMTLKDIRLLNQKAMSMYFGEEWPTKGIRVAQRQRFEDPRCGTWRIENASMMILRAAHEAIDLDDLQKQRHILNLAYAFCSCLQEGDHFRNIESLCDEIFTIYKNLDSEKFTFLPLRLRYATALRMIGKRDKSVEIFLDLENQTASKSDKQSILQGLALCYESLGNKALSIEYAQKCVTTLPNTNLALQAKAVVAAAKENGPERDKELRKIQETARKKKANIIFSQIELDFAKRATSKDEKLRIYEQLAESSRKSGDYLNFVNSTILEMQIKINTAGELNTKELARLISVYHYLYAESFDTLFDICTSILWKAFEKRGEQNNLLKLFRYSSFIWLVRNETKRELEYLKKLKSTFRDWAALTYAGASRETAYFLARASANIDVLE